MRYNRTEKLNRLGCLTREQQGSLRAHFHFVLSKNVCVCGGGVVC